jgi:hypothetical protein
MSPLKKPFFLNRLFGGMHLRERSVDSAQAASRSQEKRARGGAMVVRGALPPPPQQPDAADMTMVVTDGSRAAMAMPYDAPHDASLGRSRGRKLIRRNSDQPPPMMHDYSAAR